MSSAIGTGVTAHPGLTLTLITLVAAVLRLYHLDAQSIWYDEAISLLLAAGPLGEIVEYMRGPVLGRRPFDLNPPLYFYVLHGWLQAFGFGGLQARLLSAVTGVLAVPLLFLVARRLYDTTTGLWSALLLAVSQLGIMYSQEARPYALCLLIFLATVWFYLIAESRRSVAAWCGCALCALLLAATHYYGLFAIAALALYSVFFRSVPLPWIAAAAMAGVAAVVPWYYIALGAQLQQASGRAQPSYFAVGPWTVVSALNRFSNGGVSGLPYPAPRWTFFAGALLFGGPIILMLVRAWRPPGVADPRERRSTVLVCLLWAVPLVSAYLLSLLMSIQYDVRYIVYAIAAYYVLAGAGLARLRAPALECLAAIALVCYSGYALRANYFIPYKENYRDAIQLVAGQAEPDDCLAFVPFGGLPLEWPVYAPRPSAPRLTVDRDPSSASKCRRIWVFTYRRVVVDAHERWQEWLTAATSRYTKAMERQFFWITVERYDSRP